MINIIRSIISFFGFNDAIVDGIGERGFTITYNNQCGRSISGSVSGVGYTQNGEEQVNSASFTIPAGSGSKSGSVYFSREVVCGDVTISGHDSGNC